MRAALPSARIGRDVGIRPICSSPESGELASALVVGRGIGVDPVIVHPGEPDGNDPREGPRENAKNPAITGIAGLFGGGTGGI